MMSYITELCESYRLSPWCTPEELMVLSCYVATIREPAEA